MHFIIVLNYLSPCIILMQDNPIIFSHAFFMYMYQLFMLSFAMHYIMQDKQFYATPEPTNDFRCSLYFIVGQPLDL